ncbi:hypothetical protein Tco_0260828 [Tanacetum coccineum]
MKPRRVRAVAMTIQYGVRGMILTVQSEAFKQENVPLVGSEIDEAHASSSLISLNSGSFDVIVGMDWLSKRKFVIVCYEKVVRIPLEGDEILRVHGERTQGVTRVSYDLVIFREEHQCRLLRRGAWSSFEVSVRITEEGEVVPLVGSEMDEAHASRSPVLWAEIEESSLTRPELVLDTTDKVVLTKEKFKAASDRQRNYADERRKPLEFEVGDRVLLKVSPWKGVVSLNEIKVDKTLCFVEEPIEYSDREVISKRSLEELVEDGYERFLTSFLEDGEVYIVGWFFSLGVVMLLFVPLSGQATLLAVVYLVKVCWNSKHGPASVCVISDQLEMRVHLIFD